MRKNRRKFDFSTHADGNALRCLFVFLRSIFRSSVAVIIKILFQRSFRKEYGKHQNNESHHTKDTPDRTDRLLAAADDKQHRDHRNGNEYQTKIKPLLTKISMGKIPRFLILHRHRGAIAE